MRITTGIERTIRIVRANNEKPWTHKFDTQKKWTIVPQEKHKPLQTHQIYEYTENIQKTKYMNIQKIYRKPKQPCNN